MPIVMPGVGGVNWADLDFGGPYLKSYPKQATTNDKGLHSDDLLYGETKAQNVLYPLLRQHYPKATLDSWTGSEIPLQVQDWADELAAAFTLHLASTGGRVDRKDNYRDWAKDLIMGIKEFLMKGGVIIGADGEIVEGLTTPEKSAAGVRGPASTGSHTSEIFTEKPIEDLVELHGDGTEPREFTTEKEAYGD